MLSPFLTSLFTGGGGVCLEAHRKEIFGKSQIIVESFQPKVPKFEVVLFCITLNKIHFKVGWFLWKKCKWVSQPLLLIRLGLKDGQLMLLLFKMHIWTLQRFKVLFWLYGDEATFYLVISRLSSEDQAFFVARRHSLKSRANRQKTSKDSRIRVKYFKTKFFPS